MNINDIIDNDEENTNLDFKKEEYKKGEYVELIKDIMSMANAINNDVKRIIIGVKKTPEERDILGLKAVEDVSTYENVIQENIEPNINFTYSSYRYDDDTTLAIFEIYDNSDRPYMMKKDYGILKKGDMWIRKGTRKSRVTREDLNAMIKEKQGSAFNNKVVLGFGNDLNNSISLQKTILKKVDFPSEQEKERLESLLSELESRYYDNNGNPVPVVNGDRMDNIFSFLSGAKFNDSKKAILVGRNMGAFVYNTREELLDAIGQVKDKYFEDDCYYMYEQNGIKLNCYILNNGAAFLEEVRIRLLFDRDIFSIADKIYEEPTDHYDIVPFARNINMVSYYPDVQVQDNTVIVQTEHKYIRHQNRTEVFGEDVRLVINPKTQVSETEIQYEISAKNLPNVITGSLIVNIV